MYFLGGIRMVSFEGLFQAFFLVLKLFLLEGKRRYMYCEEINEKYIWGMSISWLVRETQKRK